MASYTVASTIRSARHVIKRILDPRFLNYTASYDVASTIHESMYDGAVAVPPPPPTFTTDQQACPSFEMYLVFDDFPLETGFELRKDSGVTDEYTAGAYTRPLLSST